MEHYKNTSLKDLVEEVDGIIYTEKWENIAGFEKLYLISNMGRVKSLLNYFKSIGIRILKQGLDTDGYPQVTLTKNGKTYPKKPHRLVALSFIPNPENKPQVNHKKGIKIDNRWHQLEWATSQEDVIHQFKVLGRKGVTYNKGKFGILNWNSKKVNQIDINTGETIKTFYGTAEAGRELEIGRRGIGRAAGGERKSYKGYKWEYV